VKRFFINSSVPTKPKRCCVVFAPTITRISDALSARKLSGLSNRKLRFPSYGLAIPGVRLGSEAHGQWMPRQHFFSTTGPKRVAVGEIIEAM
jgi:hypothetical protein